MGRIEHTLLDGAFRRYPNRPKTFARNPPQPHHTTKSYKCFYLPQRGGVLRGFIQDPANVVRRIPLLGTSVNKDKKRKGIRKHSAGKGAPRRIALLRLHSSQH